MHSANLSDFSQFAKHVLYGATTNPEGSERNQPRRKPMACLRNEIPPAPALPPRSRKMRSLGGLLSRG